MYLFAAVFTAGGIALSGAIFRSEPVWARFSLGLTAGLAAQLCLPALFAGAFGLNKPAIWSACAVFAAVCLICALKNKEAYSSSGAFELLPMLLSALPVFLYAAYLTRTHTLLPAESGDLMTGQSTFGDLPMHLAFAKSMAVRGVFPPTYSLLAGDVPLCYPFLCDAIASYYIVLGASLTKAMSFSALLALFTAFCGAYACCRAALDSNAKALLAFVLFFCGSGLGFMYFIDGAKANPSNFTRIFTAFYQTPTNYVDKNIRWVNPIVDMLIPQRATLFGWALLFGCLYLLYRAALCGKYRLFLPLGVLAGCMPMVHTHSFLALGIISGVLLFRFLLTGRLHTREGGGWAAYFLAAVSLALPQLLFFTFRQAGSDGFLRFSFNWANSSDGYFWFYIKNIGLVYILLIPAFIHSGSKNRWFYTGGLAILAIAEFIVFQPNDYDNNKLLFVWHFLGCIIVADFILDAASALYSRFAPDTLRACAAACALLVPLVFLGTFGSILTMGREAVSEYVLFDSPSVQAALYADENAPPDAVFLTSNNHNNAIASLAGRHIICSSGSYLYFHGLDYSKAEKALIQLYEKPTDASLEKWGVDYIYVSSSETANYEIDYEYFDKACELWHNRDGIRIYKFNGGK